MKLSNQICRVCGQAIQIQVNKNTGICSENCRKAEKADINAD